MTAHNDVSPDTIELQSVYDALAQAQDCIRGETPEDMTDAEAREDTINKVRDAMRAVEARLNGVAQASGVREEAIEECISAVQKRRFVGWTITPDGLVREDEDEKIIAALKQLLLSGDATRGTDAAAIELFEVQRRLSIDWEGGIAPPTQAELDARIAATEAIQAKWKGNPAYIRTLDIELYCLRAVRGAHADVAAEVSEPVLSTAEIETAIRIEFLHSEDAAAVRRAAERVFTFLSARTGKDTSPANHGTSVLPCGEGQAAECDGGSHILSKPQADYEHDTLYVYDATSQTFHPAVPRPNGESGR